MSNTTDNAAPEVPEVPEVITAEHIESLKNRADIDAVASALDVRLLKRDSIKDAKAKLLDAIAEPEQAPEQEPDAPPPNKLPGALPKGFRGTERRLKHRKTGRIFVYTPELAKHRDMVEVGE